jgi:hypothetical protein
MHTAHSNLVNTLSRVDMIMEGTGGDEAAKERERERKEADQRERQARKEAEGKDRRACRATDRERSHRDTNRERSRRDTGHETRMPGLVLGDGEHEEQISGSATVSRASGISLSPRAKHGVSKSAGIVGRTTGEQLSPRGGSSGSRILNPLSMSSPIGHRKHRDSPRKHHSPHQKKKKKKKKHHQQQQQQQPLSPRKRIHTVSSPRKHSRSAASAAALPASGDGCTTNAPGSPPSRSPDDSN